MSPTNKTCELCRKPLHGRIDQRLCNDTCRNNYNHTKLQHEKIPPHENAGEITKVIKSNYEILSRGIPGQTPEYNGVIGDVPTFLGSGIYTKFYTSSFKSGDYEWYCVFDYCYSMRMMEQPKFSEYMSRQKSSVN